MAHAHNAMLRGLDALYLQAPHVRRPRDVADLLFLAGAWSAWVARHHRLEETRMFPGFERVLGRPGCLAENVAQHRAFAGGLEDVARYARETGAGEYDGARFRAIVDGFKDALRRHLHEEIGTLRAMPCGDDGGGAAAALMEVYRACEAEAATQPKTVVPPLVMGSCDRTFPGGGDWPAMPAVGPYVINCVFSWKHAGAWRFLPTDMWRRPRPLRFLGDQDSEAVEYLEEDGCMWAADGPSAVQASLSLMNSIVSVYGARRSRRREKKLP